MRSLFGLVFFISSGLTPAAFAGELIPLPIQEIQQKHVNGTLQIIVTVNFQACRYTYKGLFLEPVVTGQGQTRIQVRALAMETSASNCTDPAEPRTDSVTLSSPTSDRYDLVPIQPH